MSDTPMTGANEFDDDDNGEKSFLQEHLWFCLLGLLIVLAIISAVTYSIWNFERQLPAAFTAKPGDSVMTYVTSTKDPAKRARIAVRAAERTRQPVYATELCGQAVQRVPGQCGRPHEVTYKLARSLASYTDTVRLNVRLYPGDFMDARNGEFVEAARPITTLSGG